MTKKTPLNIRELARETGADRASIRKWVEGITDHDEAVAVILERRKLKPESDNIDPATGLTWFQAREREHTLRLRRDNAAAERELIPAALVENVWKRVVIEFRSRVVQADIPAETKSHLLEPLEEPKIDEYFAEAIQAMQPTAEID